MKRMICFAILIIFCQTLYPQTEEDKIKSAINGYIVGTSFNYPDSVLSSFLPGANMFLDYKDNPLYVMKIEEYAGRIAKQEPGKFNGRVSNILSIQRFKGIAIVKLEVLIPSIKRRFIDLLLLKKLEAGWKIISKTAASEESARSAERALLIVSSAERRADSDRLRGINFAEVVAAWDSLKRAGYHVDIVSPLGGMSPLANINSADKRQLQYLYNADFMYALQHTLKPTGVNPENYTATRTIGEMDMEQHPVLQKIVKQITGKQSRIHQ